MKKILLIISGFFIFFSFLSSVSVFASCSYDGDIKSSIDGCFSNSKLVKAEGNLKTDENGFQEQIIDWTNRVAFYLGIAAVFAIVLSGAQLALSTGHDEKIRLAKTTFIWSIAGFLLIIFAATIITVIVRLFYSI
ncbi:hypothetical protein BKN14_03395 [Candidatus Gracilibacteria bacterium HOT-871]|nr:hypothetical protein BKN14_03395 [Candidatus Gracilibacteria bacterium HOT-871]MBB1564704.1 hypothetical protein [Candidatus Gracilibacteria bacterium]RKW23719.1 MAG: hypothetical protein D8B46_02845 [Candidatus Gracilibacteria bacterium]